MDGKWWGVLLEWTGRGKAYKTDKQKKIYLKKQQNNKTTKQKTRQNKQTKRLQTSW